jgi:anti-anti-sigma factor
MSMDTLYEQKGSTFYITISGLMDYSTIDSFNVDIPASSTNVVVDLSKLDFIDSTGIGAILSIIYKAVERGVPLELTGVNDTVKELFGTVGVFRIIDSLLKRGQ